MPEVNLNQRVKRELVSTVIINTNETKLALHLPWKYDEKSRKMQMCIICTLRQVPKLQSACHLVYMYNNCVSPKHFPLYIRDGASFHSVLSPNKQNFSILIPITFIGKGLSYRLCKTLNPFSTRPHQNVVWHNNSWIGFLKILNYICTLYVPKEREKIPAKNEPSFFS